MTIKPEELFDLFSHPATGAAVDAMRATNAVAPPPGIPSIGANHPQTVIPPVAGSQQMLGQLEKNAPGMGLEQRRQLFKSGIPSVPMGMSTPEEQQAHYGAELERENYLKNPPRSTLGKIGHVASTIGNIAGDIVAPGTMALIPGTQLHGQLERAGQMRGFNQAIENEGREAQTEGIKAGLQPVPFTDEAGNTFQVPLSKWEPLEAAKVRVQGQEKTTQQRGATQEKIAGEGNATKKEIAQGQEQSHEKIAGENLEGANERAEANRQNAFKIAQMRDNLENVISQRRENTQRDLATQEWGTPDRDLGAAPTKTPKGNPVKDGDRGKLPDGTPFVVKGGRMVVPGAPGARAGGAGTLSAQNRGRAEFAKTVVDQVPILNSEVDALADKIGPAVGRWNDYWVNKGGVNDPAFAALDQDLGLYASAVAVTHFGTRGGGQHFIEALKKDFSEAQSPENLKARIASADKWLTGYAEMGKK